MLALVSFTIAVVAVAFVAVVLRSPRLLLLVVVLGLFVTQRALVFSGRAEFFHVGIAREHVVLFTYSFAVLALVASRLLDTSNARRLPTGRTGVAGIVYVTFGLAVLWPHVSLVDSGVVHLAIGFAALLGGGYLASICLREPAVARELKVLLALAMIFEGVVCALQYAGIKIFYNASVLAQDDTLTGRAVGTFYHPSTIGKIALFAVCILLALIDEKKTIDNRIAWLGIGGAVAASIFSGARANSLALAGLILLFAILSRRRGAIAVRIRALAFVALALWVSLPYWEERIATGEDGTNRARFLSVAERFVSQDFPWFGIGPNFYVETLGKFDSKTAEGWPVHNVFMLSLIEGGLPLVLLIIGTGFAVPLMYAVRRRGVARSYAERSSRAILGAFPGLFLIAWTGWGLLADTFPTWMFTMGFMVGLMRDGQFSSEVDAESALIEVRGALGPERSGRLR